MDLLLTVTAYALIAIAIAPLLLLGLYLLANALGLGKVADHILDACGSLLMLQGMTGGLVNLLGGLAIGALGIWGFWHATGIEALLATILVPFGLWRSWRGFWLLKGLSQRQP